MSKNNVFYLFIVLFVVAIYFRNFIFFSDNQTFIFGDTAMYALYLSGFARNIESILTLKNNFLFWNPSFLGVGIPTLSIVDLGVLYPPNIIIALLAKLLNNVMLTFPLYTVSLYVHLIVGAIFVFKILNEYWTLEKINSLIGALLWTFIGYNTEFLSAGAIFLSGSYLPICFYLRYKMKSTSRISKYFVFYYLALALSFLAGYPISAIVVYLVTLAFDVLTTENKLNTLLHFLKREFAGFFLITLPIISPLYISTFINFSYSIRTKLTLDGFLSNPANISNLVESIFPTNTPFNSANRLNIVHLYFSLVGIVIFIASNRKFEIFKDKRNTYIFAIGLFCLILALGKVTPLPALLYGIVPGFGLFRRLSVFSFVAGFVFCLLVPQWVNEHKTESTNTLFIATKAILMAGTLYFIATLLLTLKLNPTLESLILPVLVGTITVVAIYFIKYGRNAFLTCMVLALFIEATFNVSSKVYINAKTNPSDIFKNSELMDKAKTKLKPYERVDLLDTQNNYNVNHLGIEQTSGYLSLASVYGVRINEMLSVNNTEYNKKPLRDILGVTKIVSKNIDTETNLKIENIVNQNVQDPFLYQFNYLASEWEPTPTDVNYYIYKRSTALPRVYIASKVIGSVQDQNILAKMHELSDSKTVFISKLDIDRSSTENAKDGNVTILEYKNNYIKTESDTTTTAFVANSTGYYPGWWAKINGEWTKPIQTNWFMQGVYVPKGKNIVEFLYMPYGVIVGLLYILVSVLTWLVYFMRSIKKAKYDKYSSTIL